MEYTIERIDTIDQITPLKSEWNSLLKKSETNIIFLTFEWIISWWKCFGKEKELFILLVKDNEKLVGIAPLMITTLNLGIKIKKIEFIGTPLSNYCDFIISEKCEDKRDVLRSIYDYLLKEKDSWDIISLKEIPEVSSTLTISEEILKSSNVLFSIFPDNISPIIIFEESERKEIEKKLNKKDIKRKLRGLNREGILGYNHCKDKNEAEMLLNIFFQQHIKRWKSTSTPSMFEDEKYKAFYHELTKSLLPKKWVDISVLRFNGGVIATQFGFTYNNKYEGYTHTYDKTYAKYSPGVILLMLNIENYLSKNFREFDLGRGDDPYKFRFSNIIKKNYKISIYKRYPISLIDKTINKLRLEIRKHSRLRYALREVKNRLTNFLKFHKC